MQRDDDGWRPIETAPRDGTWIMVFGKPSDIAGLRFKGAGIHMAQWDRLDEAFCLDGGTWAGPFIEPLFWRPLPPPPNGREEQ